MQRPIFWMTLLAYLVLILSLIAIAWDPSLAKSAGLISTRSAILVYRMLASCYIRTYGFVSYKNEHGEICLS